MGYGKEAQPLDQRIRQTSRVRPNGCWLWLLSTTNGGYGQIWVGSRRDGSRRKALAHVVSYQTFRGPVPDGLELDHLCHTPACVNPDHLETVTHQTNMDRRYERERRVARAKAALR